MLFSQLQDEVGEWSRRNFPNNTANDPFEGVVEELGELAHARLKARQGIRGTKEEHEAAEKDAIGDMLIFLADLCERNDICFAHVIEEDFNATYVDERIVESFADLENGTLAWIDTTGRDDPDRCFRRLVMSVGELPCDGFSGAGSIVVDLAAYCYRRGFLLNDIVKETWNQVKQRDWTKNKTNGQVA